jgi:hypothetical protein
MKDKILDVIKYIDENIPSHSVVLNNVREMLKSILSEEKDRGIIISQAPEQISEPFASHSCTVGNSIEQDYDDDDDFEPCDHCDLPDACADFGCAIKSGIRKDYPIDGVF